MAIGQLYGRDAEIARLRQLLDRAADGQGGAIAIRGAAGMGKTALLAQLRSDASARGWEVREVIGNPSVQYMPYAALRTLLGPELPGHGVDADSELSPPLASAIGLASTPEPPRVVAVGAALLSLLSALSGEPQGRPVLVVVDDVQWLDQSSGLALTFCARRLLADRVVFAFGARLDQTERGDADELLQGIETVELSRLSRPFAVDALMATGCDVTQASMLADRSGGVPLALMEFARLAREGALIDRRMGVPESFAARVAAQTEPVRDGLLLAALEDDLDVIARLLGGSTTTDFLWKSAESGIIEPDARSRVSFCHPLMRAAVLEGTTPEAERAAHARIAAVLDPDTDADRWALHLAAAAEQSDSRATAAIRSFARRAEARGALVEAGEAYRRAAALTPDQPARIGLLTDAADTVYRRGDVSGATAMASDTLQLCANDPALRDRAAMSLTRVSMWERPPRDNAALLDEVVASARRRGDTTTEIEALAQWSQFGFLAGDLLGGIERAAHAERLAREKGDVLTEILARALIGWNSFLAGDAQTAEAHLAPLEPVVRSLIAAESWLGVEGAELFALVWIASERWDEVDALLRDVARVAGKLGIRLSVSLAEGLLATMLVRRGRWDEAWLLATYHEEEVQYPALSACWRAANRAVLKAYMGQLDAAERLADRALEQARALGFAMVEATALAALGHCRLSAGRLEEARICLVETRSLFDSVGVREPCFTLWHGDYLDALIGLGRYAEARSLVDELADVADRTGRRWAKGVVARARALLADADDDPAAEAAFEEALKHFADVGMPFETARTLLARGEHRIRRAPDDARVDHAEARRIFMRLGAGLWAQRIEPSPSSAIPISPSSTDGSHLDRSQPWDERLADLLSPSEMRVGMSVAAGRTNRDVAAELFVSVRTVEFHLQAIYRKLGVGSRTELIATLVRTLHAA